MNIKVLLCLKYDARGCSDTPVNLTAMSSGASAHVRVALVGNVAGKVPDESSCQLGWALKG
jgi:hypothetical protein